MHPHPYLWLYMATLFVVVVVVATSVTFHREIRFRIHFGIWPREKGADRIVRSALRSQVAAMENASNVRKGAEEKFSECPDLIEEVRVKGKALHQAEGKERSLSRHFQKLTALAEKMGFTAEVKIAQEEQRRTKLRAVG